MGYVGHDAGHFALSKARWVNDFWGQFGMTFLCGMSFGFWRSRHNSHHVHCQEVGGDPDMHFGVLFSVYPESASWHTTLGRFFLRIQKWAFWPLSAFYWVTLRYDGIRDLFQRPKETKIDRFLMPLHWLVLLIVPGLVFGWPTALLAYVTVSCLSSLMTVSVFIPNHIGMRRLDPGHAVSYLEQQVTTSRNIANPPLLDFYLRRPQLPDRAPPVPAVAHNRYREMRADRARLLRRARHRVSGGRPLSRARLRRQAPRRHDGGLPRGPPLRHSVTMVIGASKAPLVMVFVPLGVSNTPEKVPVARVPPSPPEEVTVIEQVDAKVGVCPCW